MIVDVDWKAGLAIGLEADEIYVGNENNEVSDEPVPVWYLHLGFLTVAFVFN